MQASHLDDYALAGIAEAIKEGRYTAFFESRPELKAHLDKCEACQNEVLDLVKDLADMETFIANMTPEQKAECDRMAKDCIKFIHDQLWLNKRLKEFGTT